VSFRLTARGRNRERLGPADPPWRRAARSGGATLCPTRWPPRSG